MNVVINEVSLMLMNCGSASKRTKGLPSGFARENAPYPFNRSLFP
jgi:hypothetical protein